MKKTLLVLFAAVSTCISLNAQVIFNVKTPASLTGNYGITVATTGWGCPDMNIAANAIEETLVFVGTDSLACTPATNGAALAGKIAVLYRGSCEFGAKAKVAQDAGAIGVIVINNQGAPIAMGAGAVGAEVTIPTVMISTEDGAKLRNEIKAGNVRGFIGTKAGLYPNDLGYKPEQVIYPPMASRPLTMSTTAGDFVVEPGLWVYNFGSATQTGINVTANITKNGSNVYSKSQSIATMNSGDSVFVTFEAFGPAFTEIADYELTYDMGNSGTEGYPDDNMKKMTFSITNGNLSYARTEPTTKLPVGNNFVRSTTASPNLYCMSFRDPKAADQQVMGFSFAVTPQTPYDMTDEYFEIEMFEWNDPFADITDEPTFDDLNSIAFAEYTYADNTLGGKTVFVPYTDGVVKLNADQRYLICLKQLTDSLFFGFNNEIDYSANIDKYREPISPVKGGATWYDGGFGSNTTSSIGVHFVNLDGISEKMVNAEGTPFPTPSNQYVNIPFKSTGAKVANITVMDMTGKLVESTTGTVEGSALRVNTTTLGVGSYIFNVNLDNGKTSSFRVLIGR